MTVQAMAWARLQSGLSPAAKLLLLELADAVCDDGIRQWKIGDLAAFVGVKPGLIGDLAEELGAAGLIDVVYVDPACLNARVLFPQEERRPDPFARRPISAARRAEILRRDGHRCVVCQSPERLQIDHILPITRGGKNSASNLQVLCKGCNESKRDKLMEDWLPARLAALGLERPQ